MSTAPRSVIVKGTGSYTPPKALTNNDLSKTVDTSDEWIFSRTGIRERRIAGEDETSSSMGAQAGLRAIQDAGIQAEDIDVILVGTMSPDMIFPSTACLVQDKLGIKQAMCFDVVAACSGFLYIMEVASGLLSTGRYRNALVVGAEKLSSILDWEDRTTCVLFGDGAGAAVLTLAEEGQSSGIIDFKLGADGSKAELLHQPAGGCALPPSAATLENRQHFLKMRGQEIFKNAVRVMGQAAVEILEQNGIEPDQLKCVIPHQANMRIIESLSTRLHIPIERFFLNLDKYGNTSAASIPIALDEAVRAGRVERGDVILLVAFGAGLTWGSTLLRW